MGLPESRLGAMASEILYKFKSSNEYASLRFDGSFISVGEVKRVVAEKSGISMDQACELLLTNAQSNIGEFGPLGFLILHAHSVNITSFPHAPEYKDDSALIPKNTSVVVRRVPAMRKMPIGTSSATTSQHQYVPSPTTYTLRDNRISVNREAGFAGISNRRTA